MGVIQRYMDFRWLFAKRITIPGTFTFAKPSGFSSILRATGNYIADGVKVGMTVRAIGSALNDGRAWTVSPLWEGSASQSTLLLLDAAPGAFMEGPTACTLHCVTMANDGYEEYPGLFAGQAGRYNLVRAKGFNADFTGIPASYDGNGFDVTVNGFAVDVSPGVDDYHWYLSQRTDDPAKQYLTIGKPHSHIAVPPNTLSGTVGIRHTALATSELGIAGAPSVDQVIELFHFCYLYCRRRADGAIQWLDLLRGIFA